jgi:Zn-dependent protease with chaperone function
MAIDKTPLKSKKFIAFFFSLIVIAAILIIALFTQPITWPMSLFMGIGILAVGIVAIGYVLSQGVVDKFIQGVTGIAGAVSGKKEEPKDGGDSDQPMGEV